MTDTGEIIVISDQILIAKARWQSWLMTEITCARSARPKSKARSLATQNPTEQAPGTPSAVTVAGEEDAVGPMATFHQFMDLPAEIRLKIYEFAVEDSAITCRWGPCIQRNERYVRSPHFHLLLTCRLVYTEAIDMYRTATVLDFGDTADTEAHAWRLRDLKKFYIPRSVLRDASYVCNVLRSEARHTLPRFRDLRACHLKMSAQRELVCSPAPGDHESVLAWAADYTNLGGAFAKGRRVAAAFPYVTVVGKLQFRVLQPLGEDTFKPDVLTIKSLATCMMTAKTMVVYCNFSTGKTYPVWLSDEDDEEGYPQVM